MKIGENWAARTGLVREHIRCRLNKQLKRDVWRTNKRAKSLRRIGCLVARQPNERESGFEENSRRPNLSWKIFVKNVKSIFSQKLGVKMINNSKNVDGKEINILRSSKKKKKKNGVQYVLGFL